VSVDPGPVAVSVSPDPGRDPGPAPGAVSPRGFPTLPPTRNSGFSVMLHIVKIKPSVEDSMSSPALRGSAEWSASREVALLLGLTRGNLHAAQQLWLRKERIKAEASQVASAGAPQASQQPAGCQAKPAPARAQAVPKPETAAQLARRERSQIRLRQKHLASKMWATIRIASRLLAWRHRARARRDGSASPKLLDRVRVLVERDAAAGRIAFGHRNAAVAARLGFGFSRLPILVGTLLLQQWPSVRARCPRPAALPAPSTSSTVAAQPQPALALAAPPPPSQPPPSALAAAARAALDACELQDDRGSKRDALTRTPPRPAATPTPPPPAEPRKKTRGGGLDSAFAAAAPAAAAQPPPTATNYHAAALAAADPNRRFA